MGNVTTNPGYYQRLTDDRGRIIQQPWWGAPAAHFPVVAGVMTLDELYAGHIDHAINFTLRDVRKGVWSWPAQATDGRNAGSQYIPQGAHFRFDPNLDLDSLDLPPMTRMIAEAVQKYGMILENSSGGIVFRADDPKPLGIDPYYGPNRQPGDPEDLFSKWPVDLMRAFPWEHLQLLKMDLRDANGPVSE
jgi:hypothetical protein